MTNKELYTDWAVQQEYLPIFMQPWWLDAVCAGKEWDVLLSKDSHGNIRAALPYLIRKKWGMKWIVMPQQTQIGGIWLAQNGGLIEGTDEAIDIRTICEDLVNQLRAMRTDYYHQQYPIGSKAVDVMKALGFRVRERVTYRLEDLHDIDAVIRNFNRNKKRQLAKAENLILDFNMSEEDFYAFHRQTLAEQKKNISYSREFFLVLHRKATRNHQGQILRLRDAEGHIHAAAFVIWDQHVMHYLIATYSSIGRNNGAMARMVLECIKFAREKGVIFDFEGSMIKGVAEHFRQFGATPATYYSVEKYNNPLFAIVLATNWIRNIHKR